MKIGVYTFQEGKEPKDLENKIKKLKKQLKIAVEALDLYKNLRGDGTLKNYESVAVKALKQIQELKQDD